MAYRNATSQIIARAKASIFLLCGWCKTISLKRHSAKVAYESSDVLDILSTWKSDTWENTLAAVDIWATCSQIWHTQLGRNRSILAINLAGTTKRPIPMPAVNTDIWILCTVLMLAWVYTRLAACLLTRKSQWGRFFCRYLDRTNT